MYSRPEALLTQYDFTVDQIHKGRGNYICETDGGMMLLVPFAGSKERAAGLRKILIYLNEQGYKTEKIYETHAGEPVCTDEYGGKYLLKDMISGTECSTKNCEDMIAAVEALAKLHVLLNQCPDVLPGINGDEKGELLTIFEKHNRELIKVRNYIKTKNRKNEFEQLFWQNLPYYLGQAEQSMTLLRGACQEKKVEVLCHGNFNQHNILHTADGWEMIGMETLTMNLPVSDLANFVRKMMEKNNWNLELGLSLVRAYQRILPLKEEEKKQLYVLLLFPEKFWKVANHYYNSHKAWLDRRDIEKLQQILAQEPAREKFLAFWE